MKRKYISELIGNEFKQWKIGNLILIASGTGTGKTFFVKNELNTYCKENKYKILFLTNRDNLKEQVKKDIKGNSNITVLNYQKIEAFILNNVQFNNYDFVVMDEAHYFFTDSAFSCKTDLFFKRMLNDNSICKILITATPLLLKSYLQEKEIEINYNYELKTDYNYLNKIIAFNDYESIDNIIESIPQNEQILLFSSAKRSYQISKKYNGSFICSKHNKGGYYRYVEETENEEELESIINDGEFKNHLLCTTTALDNGINIKEGTPVKHIIIDIFDRDTFIQCLGRKRVSEGEKVNLYFYAYNDNKQINGFKSKVVNSINRADFLKIYGQKEYIISKYKNESFTDTRIIDDILDNNGNIQKVVNECMYAKYKMDLLLYNSILSKKYPNSFKNIIALALNIKKEEIIDMETKIITSTLEEAFEKSVGKKLFKEEQKELKEFLKKNGLEARTLGINTINGYLKDCNLNYIIDSKRETKGENYRKTYWIIGKITY